MNRAADFPPRPRFGYDEGMQFSLKRMLLAVACFTVAFALWAVLLADRHELDHFSFDFVPARLLLTAGVSFGFAGAGAGVLVGHPWLGAYLAIGLSPIVFDILVKLI